MSRATDLKSCQPWYSIRVCTTAEGNTRSAVVTQGRLDVTLTQDIPLTADRYSYIFYFTCTVNYLNVRSLRGRVWNVYNARGLFVASIEML